NSTIGKASALVLLARCSQRRQPPLLSAFARSSVPNQALRTSKPPCPVDAPAQRQALYPRSSHMSRCHLPVRARDTPELAIADYPEKAPDSVVAHQSLFLARRHPPRGEQPQLHDLHSASKALSNRNTTV